MRLPTDSGDKVVEEIKRDISLEIDLLASNTHKRHRSNLSKAEREGLKRILHEINHGDLRVVLADKGGALCIVPQSFIKQLESDKLSDTASFENLGPNEPITNAQTNLLDLWRKGEDASFVTRVESKEVVGLCEKKDGKPQRLSTASDFKPRTPYFYGLLKIHKLAPESLKPGVKIPIRLVTNLSKSVTSRSDKFINWRFLQPLQNEFCKDLAKDSTDVLQWLENVHPINPPSGFSWDFVSLYDNLTPSLVMEALSQAIDELRPDWSPEMVDWLLELVRLSLDSSFAKYGENWYKSKIGIPTGGALSVTLANIAVFYVLRKVVYGTDFELAPSELLGVKRFVDDLGGLWTGSRDQFISWSNDVNIRLQEFGLSIKEDNLDPWDFNTPGEFTTLLDIKFQFNQAEGLVTDVNIKETDSRAFLHFTSSHPRQTFPSIVYSQALRFRRIIKDNTLLNRRLCELGECFYRSGYPKKMVDGIMKDVSGRPRTLNYRKKETGAPYPVVWVQTFGPATDAISKVVKQANKVIKQSEVWKDVVRPIGIVNRRGRNLGDIVLKQKHFALQNDMSKVTGTSRCTPKVAQGKRKKDDVLVSLAT